MRRSSFPAVTFGYPALVGAEKRQTRAVDMGNLELDALGTQLRASNREAYVKALLVRSPNGWDLYHAWALIGAEPPNWAVAVWEYGQLAFVSCRIPAANLAGLCSNQAGESVALGQFDAVIPAANGPTNWTHRPSYARHERYALPMPTTDYMIQAASQSIRQVTHHTLVAEDAPSFPEPNSAWRAFMEGDFSLTGAGQPPNELALLRVAEDKAWIGNVHVTATQLTASVHGTDVLGTQLELFGVSDRRTERLEEPGTVTFPLSDGLPKSAWLWLKRGSAWADYRSIDAQSGWTGDLERAGVNIERPVEPEANIEALIASGESARLEFKEKLPAGTNYRRTLKTVAAFATGDGGTIIFGVNRDEVTITGLGNEEPSRLRDNLVHLIRAAVTPTPHVTVSPYTISGKLILVLDVEPGQSPPYGLIPDPPGNRDKPDYYVRRGANTFPAQPSDLREAVLASQPPSIPATTFGYG